MTDFNIVFKEIEALKFVENNIQELTVIFFTDG